MNVEQLIEDGQQTLFDEIYRCNAMKAFDLGVRHALAAMFPVVDSGDLEEGDRVWGKLTEGDWHVVSVQASGKIWDYKLTRFVVKASYTEFRRCPTPAELGVW